MCSARGGVAQGLRCLVQAALAQQDASDVEGAFGAAEFRHGAECSFRLSQRAAVRLC